MAGMQTDLVLGWQVCDPGESPMTPVMDIPPVVAPEDLLVAHRDWKARAIQDQQRIDQMHAQTPVWFPVTGAGRVLPVYGGTEGALPTLLTTLVGSAVNGGFDRISVTNLLPWRVLDNLRIAGSKTRKFSSAFAVVSSGRSTVSVFEQASLDDLTSTIADITRTQADRTGARAAGRDKQRLMEVGRLLDQPVTVEVLRDAIDVVRGTPPQSLTTTFAVNELRALRDFRANVVAPSQGLPDQLNDLHADLCDLAQFLPARGAKPDIVGQGPLLVRTTEVGMGSSTHQNELAREVLARAAARSFGGKPRGAELLVLVGAEVLADEVLDSLTAAAAHFGKQLVLIFTRITDKAAQHMGHGGSGSMVFLKLPNHDDAVKASDQLGRDFIFVINGITITEGSTTQWTDTYGTSTSNSHASGRTSSRNSGGSGLALNWGRSVGTSVTDTFTQGTNQAHAVGGGTNHATAVNAQRTKEAVVEPEVFQQMDERSMMVVNDRVVTLANFDPKLRKDPLTSTRMLVP